MADHTSVAKHIEAVVPEIDTIQNSIALGMALTQASDIAAELRVLSGVGPQENLLLTNGKARVLLKGAEVAASKAGQGWKTFGLEQVRNENPELLGRLHVACRHTAPEALNLLRPLLTLETIPTRSEFEAVARWTAIADMQAAYRLTVNLLDCAGELRDDALRAVPSATHANPPSLGDYYGVVLGSAQMLLLAGIGEGQPWRTEIAKGLMRRKHIPTFLLVRERTLWLFAAAARFAAALGQDAIDPYVEKLVQADHPAIACDALMGLVAIACSSERDFNRISRQIGEAHDALLDRGDAYLSYTVRAFRSATMALRLKAEGIDIPPCIQRHTAWRNSAREGLATPEAFRADPFDPCETGEMLGLMSIPTILKAPFLWHFPARAARTAQLTPSGSELVALLHRAWKANPRKLN